MNESHNNNSEELLENNPAENTSELPTSQEQSKPWYSQPAGLVSLFLIVAALILLALWLSKDTGKAVSYTHLRAHETVLDIVCRLLLEKKKTIKT